MKLIKSEYHKEINQFAYTLEGECFKLEETTAEANNRILNVFYKGVEWLLSKHYDEYKEIESNTLNPAQQNTFLPLRVYRIFKNGHYKQIEINVTFWGDCLITETNF